ncbi:hypothetical protein [Subtercola sp. YIM 133946]|uniref:hypothetical protein n=1 Tax=Subtercola sp. YIM 133946 TaxID=3118909 RepID=UPI002F959C31
MSRRAELPREFQRRAFSTADARQAGVRVNRLRASDLSAPFRGVRSASDELRSVRDWCDAYAPRLKPGQFFSHATAALLWGLPVASARLQPLPLHVSVLGARRAGNDHSGRAPTAARVIGHSLTDPCVLVTRRFGHPVVDICTAWCQLAPFVCLDELIAAGDAAVLTPAFRRQGDPRPFTTVAELEARIGGYVGRGKRMLTTALPVVRDGAESPRETSLRLLLIRAGLPEPELNVDVFDARGTWAARADLFYRRQRVVVEYDGDQHRTDRAIYENDQVRLERLLDADCLVVKVRDVGLRHDAAHTVARVRKALRARGMLV